MKKLLGKLKSPAIQGISLAAHSVFRAQGYRLELRRSGELKLGLWRKSWRKPLKGRAKRLVVIPGFGDTPLTWLLVVELLRPVIRARFDEIVLLDFPGFQGSLAREKSFHSMDLLMEKTFDALDTLKPEVILGHSLGGWVASRYAGLCGRGERPGTIRKDYAGPELLILADSSGVFGDESLKKAWTERFQHVIDGGFRHLRPHVFGREPFWFNWLLSEFEAFTSKEEILLFMKSVRDDHLVEDLLPHVKAKVFLLWGEKDTLTPPAFAYGWLRLLPATAEAQVMILNGVGHSPQIEAPGATAAVLAKWLSLKAERSLPALLPERLTRRWWRRLQA